MPQKNIRMDLDKIDRSAIKTFIKEVLLKDPGMLKEIIEEIFNDGRINVSKDQQVRREDIKEMIEEDFDTYYDVFNALSKQ